MLGHRGIEWTREQDSLPAREATPAEGPRAVPAASAVRLATAPRGDIASVQGFLESFLGDETWGDAVPAHEEPLQPVQNKLEVDPKDFSQSRVLGPEGGFLKVYHGTPVKPGGIGDNITEFNRNWTLENRRRQPSMDNVGVWFSTLRGDKEKGAAKYAGSEGLVYEANLNIRNPYVTTFANLAEKNWELNGHPSLQDGIFTRSKGSFSPEPLRTWLKAQGYDGVQIVHDPASKSTEFQDQDAWIVLESEQARILGKAPATVDLPKLEHAHQGPAESTPGPAVTDLTMATKNQTPQVQEVKAPSTRAPKAMQPFSQQGEGGDFSSDDPNSPQYRYRDTGYVQGSRKELSAISALQIRSEARAGRSVRSTSIDWAAIEQNPREAKALITKSHLFGAVDWEALKAGGMEPGAGFLVDRVYGAIGKEPSEDSPEARRDYAIGLETLRDRLEACKTPDDVTKALDKLKDESLGFVLDEGEQAAHDLAQGQREATFAKIWANRDEERKVTDPLNAVKSEISQIEWDQGKRERRGWKRDPELDARLQDLLPKRDDLEAQHQEWKSQHPEALDTYEKGRFGSPLMAEVHRLGAEMDTIRKGATLRNLVENPLCRAWALMGDRFVNVLGYRGSRGSDAFQGHVSTAKAGKISDWSWAEKEVTRVATSTKESVRFQLKVADSYDRVGGRKMEASSSAELKAAFGLREAEYGLWVAEDFNSAKFHTERCAEGLADLADLLGVEDRAVALGGQLSMGFGSRGQGAIGWRTSAPAATYFTMNRIINLTKMAGGGTLGHEWSHALDNIFPELATGHPSGVEDFASENPNLLPAGPLRNSMKDLVDAMTSGPHRHNEEIAYTGRDVLVAKQNMDRTFSSYGKPHIAQLIREAGSVDQAVLRIKAWFQGQLDREGNMTRSAKTAMKTWSILAAAYYGKEPDGGKMLVKAGEPMSRFAYEALNLDAGSKTPYWSTHREMFARAFQAWTEDKLQGMGRQNDYLSWHADNRYYVDPIFGPNYPFPEGDERVRINQAFDRLFEAVRASKALLDGRDCV